MTFARRPIRSTLHSAFFNCRTYGRAHRGQSFQAIWAASRNAVLEEFPQSRKGFAQRRHRIP